MGVGTRRPLLMLRQRYACHQNSWDICTLPSFPGATFWGKSCEWMLGITPPPEIVTLLMYLLSSSSFRMASWMCLG